MKRLAVKFAAIAVLASLVLPAIAQDTKEKDKDKKKEVEQIIITKKGDDQEKIVIEIQGDKITINGKLTDELKDQDIKVLRNKYKSIEGLNAFTLPRGQGGNFNFNFDNHDGFGVFSNVDENRALLGVVTEKSEKGAKVNEVTEKSAAEKAGIKPGDIITKVGDSKIETPDDLSTAIRKNKPGEKVNITLLRDNKEQKLNAELGKWSGFGSLALSPRMPDMDIFREALPRIQSVPRTPYGQNWVMAGGAPRLGLSVQDTDDGKGVKVIDVDSESNAAKAGVKENDIITHVNDKEVNGADEVARMVKENKDKVSIQLKIKRDGKVQNIEVKMPRKLKTANL
ncbi:MAG TPA: PDZ domain-containing protein [Chitinophagaceae bacterium]|nr:PDZ domain-containing protein [Chitinophagaceae bacterium]